MLEKPAAEWEKDPAGFMLDEMIVISSSEGGHSGWCFHEP
jgi:hypothetical protein